MHRSHHGRNPQAATYAREGFFHGGIKQKWAVKVSSMARQNTSFVAPWLYKNTLSENAINGGFTYRQHW